MADDSMLRFAERVMKTVADVTIGSVIVLVHVAIADRERGVPKHGRQRFGSR